jgi:hypothetical protein
MDLVYLVLPKCTLSLFVVLMLVDVDRDFMLSWKYFAGRNATCSTCQVIIVYLFPILSRI